MPWENKTFFSLHFSVGASAADARDVQTSTQTIWGESRDKHLFFVNQEGESNFNFLLHYITLLMWKCLLCWSSLWNLVKKIMFMKNPISSLRAKDKCKPYLSPSPYYWHPAMRTKNARTQRYRRKHFHLVSPAVMGFKMPVSVTLRQCYSTLVTWRWVDAGWGILGVAVHPSGSCWELRFFVPTSSSFWE